MRSTVSDIEEKMEAAVHSLRAWRKETMACQETTGTSGAQGVNLRGHGSSASGGP
jgi:hypothetical protein